MLAPGTRCCSSGCADGSGSAGLDTLNSVGSPAWNAVVSRSETDDSGLPDRDSGAAVPTRRSVVGTSGWNSSAAGAVAREGPGPRDSVGGGCEPETALAEVLSDEPSVIAAPLPVPSPVADSGRPRRRGSRAG